MISGFISKLLFGRELEWSEKEIKIFGKDFCLQPVDILLSVQKKLKDKKKSRILYESAKENFFHFSKEMSKYGDKELFMRYMLTLISHLGFGTLKVVDLKESSAKVQVEKNRFAEMYRKKFGTQKEPVDLLLAGMIAGFFSAYFGKDVDCKEKFCAAQGKNVCSFFVQ
jgi:predicted hydrocarbon binding protein